MGNLLVEAVFLLNHKGAVQTPGKSGHGAEQRGQSQEHQRLGDLIVRAEPEPSRHRTGQVPQKWDSAQQQDQLKGPQTKR